MRASAIFVDGGCKNILITQNNFTENYMSFWDDYIKRSNNDLYNFFP